MVSNVINPFITLRGVGMKVFYHVLIYKHIAQGIFLHQKVANFDCEKNTAVVV